VLLGECTRQLLPHVPITHHRLCHSRESLISLLSLICCVPAACPPPRALRLAAASAAAACWAVSTMMSSTWQRWVAQSLAAQLRRWQGQRHLQARKRQRLGAPAHAAVVVGQHGTGYHTDHASLWLLACCRTVACARAPTAAVASRAASAMANTSSSGWHSNQHLPLVSGVALKPDHRVGHEHCHGHRAVRAGVLHRTLPGPPGLYRACTLPGAVSPLGVVVGAHCLLPDAWTPPLLASWQASSRTP